MKPLPIGRNSYGGRYNGWCGRVLGLLLLVSSATGGTPDSRAFIWNEANQAMGTAATPADYARAAAIYRQLLDDGVSNAPLLHNLGTALLQAGRHEEARRMFLRAERYAGYDWDIQHNLLIAAARGRQDELPSPPWYRFFLFWHFGLSTRLRVTIAAGAFAVFWILMIARTLGWDQPFRRLALVSLLAVALFGSSAATSIVQERRDAATGTETAPRKGTPHSP